MTNWVKIRKVKSVNSHKEKYNNTIFSCEKENPKGFWYIGWMKEGRGGVGKNIFRICFVMNEIQY